MIILKEDLSEFTNVVTIQDRQFIEIPNLVCVKCFNLIQVTVLHEPDRIEIYKCKCKE